MTDAAPTLAGIDMLPAAQAAIEGLLPGMTWSAEPADPELDNPVPGSGASAVQVSLGDYGRLVIVTSKALSRQVQVGPPPAEDLIDGLTPALELAFSTISAEVGAALSHTELEEIDPVAALAPGPGEVRECAFIMESGTHAATVAVVTPEPPAPELPVVHDFGPLPQARGGTVSTGLELLHEVEMGVTAELGRTRMQVRDILDLCPGSVIELDRAAGSPVDILVNGTLIARGEVVVIDEEFGVRITEVIGYDESSGKRTA